MMKELDFDELDQAVSSLMSGIPKAPAPSDDKADEKTLTITPTLSETERPAFGALEQAASKAGAELEKAEAAAPLAARRSGGRFMDVVHPSSDMKINNRPVVSREGIQLNPISRPIEAPSPAPTPTPEPEVSAVTVDQTPEVVEQAPGSSAWPDPIDMMSTPVAPVEEPVAPESEAVEEQPVVDTPEVDEAEELAPLQTPFLADTKVEKRPLGAFAIEQPDAMVAADTEEVAVAPAAVEVPPQQDVVTAELPDELQHDLIKIESDNDASQDEAVEEAPAPSFSAPVVTPAPASVPGPASIQPQYKEEPSSTKEEHAAIYDTDSYHQPLAHPVKKKSGWLWVLWIVLLLALGAGGAAALYYFKLI